jgi:solute carrier family 38 (sodium-coupled neutral amino acid transporter), member 11
MLKDENKNEETKNDCDNFTLHQSAVQLDVGNYNTDDTSSEITIEKYSNSKNSLNRLSDASVSSQNSEELNMDMKPNKSMSFKNEQNYNCKMSDNKIPLDPIDPFDDQSLDRRSGIDCFKRFFGPIKGGSLRGSIFSLASICFDTTCLSFPLALWNMGLIPGTFLLVTMGLLSYWSLYILLVTGRLTKIYNYRKLIKSVLGEKMALLSDMNNIIFSIGAQTAYIVTISKFFHEVLFGLFGIQKTNIIKIIQMTICMIFFQVPLSLLKNISKLQYASILGSLVLIFTLVVMFIQSFFYFQEGQDKGRSIQLVREINWNYLDSFSVFLFAFSPHNGLFLIFSEMAKPNLRRTKTVLNRAMLLQCFIFFIIAYAGFFSLLENFPSIFLSRPPLKQDPNDYYIISAKILFFFSLHCLCAINFNLLRGTISSLFYKGKNITDFQNFYVTAIMFVLSNLVAFFANNVVEIISIISGISVTFICYVFPVMCYVRANHYKRYHYKNVISMTIMILISCVGLISTFKSGYENYHKWKEGQNNVKIGNSTLLM